MNIPRQFGAQEFASCAVSKKDAPQRLFPWKRQSVATGFCVSGQIAFTSGPLSLRTRGSGVFILPGNLEVTVDSRFRGNDDF
jgi:hypothetical protein